LYAGAADKDLSSTPPPAVPEKPEALGMNSAVIATGVGDRVRLQLRSQQEGITFHVEGGSSIGTGMGWAGGYGRQPGGPIVMGIQQEHFQRLCTAPCSVDLPPGSYTFALKMGDKGPVKSPALDIKAASTLEGAYVSHEETRWLLIGASTLAVIGGFVLGLSSKKVCKRNTTVNEDVCEKEMPYMVPGLVVTLAGAVGVFVAVSIKDKAEIQVSPLVP
jgi:hypothetical protein